MSLDEVCGGVAKRSSAPRVAAPRGPRQPVKLGILWVRRTGLRGVAAASRRRPCWRRPRRQLPLRRGGRPLSGILLLGQAQEKCEHRTSNIEHRTLNIEHRASNIEHRTSNGEHRTSNVGRWTLDVRCLMLLWRSGLPIIRALDAGSGQGWQDIARLVFLQPLQGLAPGGGLPGIGHCRLAFELRDGCPGDTGFR